MKQEKEIWRLRAEYVRWAALLAPALWNGIPLEHCWIDGHSGYAFSAEFAGADGSTVQLTLPTGKTIPVALEMLGPEEIHRVGRESGDTGLTPPPHEAACA